MSVFEFREIRPRDKKTETSHIEFNISEIPIEAYKMGIREGAKRMLIYLHNVNEDRKKISREYGEFGPEDSIAFNYADSLIDAQLENIDNIKL